MLLKTLIALQSVQPGFETKSVLAVNVPVTSFGRTPEQIRGTPEVSHKTDLYALGVLFYQMLTGKMPFEGNSAVVRACAGYVSTTRAM